MYPPIYSPAHHIFEAVQSSYVDFEELEEMAYLLQQIFVPIMLVFFPKGAGLPMEKSLYINTCILYEKCVPSTFFFLDVGGLAIQALFDYFDFE